MFEDEISIQVSCCVYVYVIKWGRMRQFKFKYVGIVCLCTYEKIHAYTCV